MKKIMFSEYNPSMGILIDVQHPLDYKENPTPKQYPRGQGKPLKNPIK